MPKQQTKYCKQWELSQPRLKSGSNKYLGRCTFCNKEFQVDGTGAIQVDSHADLMVIKRKPLETLKGLCVLLQEDSLAPQVRMK